MDRPGVTLLELVLVLSILVVVATMAVPTLTRTFEGQKVEKGADLVRAQMGMARVKAIRSGKVTAFMYQPGSSRFTVLEFDTVSGRDSLQGFFDGSTEAMRSSNFDFSEEQLPRGVTFLAGETQADARSEFESEQVGASMGAVKPILFYPDGSSQDARLVLINEQGAQMQINLRGLTGSSSLRRVDQ
jgi:prepilin-type N-terminal cleavage/methylation domain-containing protein